MCLLVKLSQFLFLVLKVSYFWLIKNLLQLDSHILCLFCPAVTVFCFRTVWHWIHFSMKDICNDMWPCPSWILNRQKGEIFYWKANVEHNDFTSRGHLKINGLWNSLKWRLFEFWNKMFINYLHAIHIITMEIAVKSPLTCLNTFFP